MTTNYVKSWFARGDDDLALVKLILEKGTGSPNLACFHAQQAVEKYLKGFLAHHDLHVRKVHDLEVLLEDCKNIDTSFTELQDGARFLSQFYVESRYPDDYVEFPREDAEKASEAALRVKEFVLAKVKSPRAENGFGTLGVLAVIAAVLALAGGGYFAYQRFVKTADTGRTACSAEAKLCPDGSAVGRTGPNCEFAECPASPQPPGSEIDTSGWKTYRNEQYGFEVGYPKGWEIKEVKANDGFAVHFTHPVVLEKVLAIGIVPNPKKLSIRGWLLEQEVTQKVLEMQYKDRGLVDGLLAIEENIAGTVYFAKGDTVVMIDNGIQFKWKTIENQVFEKFLTTFKFIR